jgi:hypothetical protein
MPESRSAQIPASKSRGDNVKTADVAAAAAAAAALCIPAACLSPCPFSDAVASLWRNVQSPRMAGRMGCPLECSLCKSVLLENCTPSTLRAVGGGCDNAARWADVLAGHRACKAGRRKHYCIVHRRAPPRQGSTRSTDGASVVSAKSGSSQERHRALRWEEWNNGTQVQLATGSWRNQRACCPRTTRCPSQASL